DEIEAADRLLRLRERTVRDQLLPASHADGAAATRRRKLVAGHPFPPRLHVVQPRKALRFLLRSRLGLRLTVHPLGVPTDQQQVPHLAPLVVADVRTTDGAAPDRHFMPSSASSRGVRRIAVAIGKAFTY